MAAAVGRSAIHSTFSGGTSRPIGSPSRAIHRQTTTTIAAYSSPNVSTQGPIRFHPFHGENIVLLEDRRRALRSASFEKALVFSDRPLCEGEPFCVSIEGVEGGWTGHLRVGLTVANPSDRPDSSTLSSTSWMVPISPFSSLDHPSTSLPTEIGSRIGFYYLRQQEDPDYARLYVVLNGQNVLSEMERIPIDRPLYAVVDVFGNTKEVRTAAEMNAPARLSELCSRRVRSLVSDGGILACLVQRLPPTLQQELFP